MSTLVVLNAGLSSPSSTRMLAERIAGAVEAQVSKRGEGLETRILDLRDYASDLATVMATGIPTAALTEAQELVSGADALIAASPVFTASYSGLFKMFMDALGTDSLNGMPVVIAATAGTPRHSLVLDFAMRPLFTYLRAAVMPTGVFAATEDFGAETDLDRRVQRAAAELA
ncbi:CE1759 family FMN reductase, partial [Corynebacterium bovis]